MQSSLEDTELGLSKDSEILCPPSIESDKEDLLNDFEER